MRFIIIVLLFLNGSSLRGAPVDSVVVDSSAPLFSLVDLKNGQTIHLEQYRGKVVYLDFWASWCVPCRASFPALSALYQQYSDQGFEVIAVNLDENHSEALQFIEQYPADYRFVAGFDTGIASTYRVDVMPTAYFIDAKGVVRLIHHGFKESHVDFLEAILEKLLAER